MFKIELETLNERHLLYQCRWRSIIIDNQKVSELVTIFKHRAETKGEESRFKQDSPENRTVFINEIYSDHYI